MIYVEKGNLPCKAEVVILGEEYYPILAKVLEGLGIKSIALPSNPHVDKRLSSHADLSVFHGGNNILFAADYLKNTDFEEQLKEFGFSIFYPKVNISSEYPFDCYFNACYMGKYSIACHKTAAYEIIEFIGNKSQIISCNQGYSKCLVSVVDDNSIITSDRGIADLCRQQGIDVLEISSGGIDLDGFNYGFIGGSSFKLSQNVMAFTGTIDHLPDYDKIICFLGLKNVEHVVLTDRKIFDVGSILPIIEQQR